MGPPGSRLRRSVRAGVARRPRAGRARQQSYRTHVYGRRLGRVALSGTLSRGLRKPAGRMRPRGWSRAARRTDQRRATLRAPTEQTDTRAIAALFSVSVRRRRSPDEPSRRRRPGRDRYASRDRGSARITIRFRYATAIRTWKRSCCRALEPPFERHVAGVVSPEPAKYQHGRPHRTNAGRHLYARESACRRLTLIRRSRISLAA